MTTDHKQGADTKLVKGWQVNRLRQAAELLDRYVEMIEPIFKCGSEHFAPTTDWWSIIAGWRHNAKADANMLRGMANQGYNQKLYPNGCEERCEYCGGTMGEPCMEEDKS